MCWRNYCKWTLVCLSFAAQPIQNASGQADPAKNYLTYGADRGRTGWIANETVLTPDLVKAGGFGSVWNSPQFDSVQIGSTNYLPKMYASPLYVDSVNLSSGTYAGHSLSTVVAATSNGFVYAVNAFAAAGVPAGTILWKSKLTDPEVVPTLDGGVPMGVLGTPVADVSSSPARVYVASDDVAAGWRVFALDLTSGQVLPGWPVDINNASLAPVNRNGPATFQQSSAMSQRGALNLSADGSVLYVPFGAYGDGGAGWMVAVDTGHAKLSSAFAGAPSSVAFANGGMWGAAGPTIDANGSVYVTTGNGTTENETTPGYWGQSVLQWGPTGLLQLTGTYSPFNYCLMDQYDTDMAASAPMVLPDLGSANTKTPHLLAVGGKQGNVYLLDRDHLPGGVAVRQGCSTDSASDRSLLPPTGQPQFGGALGPLNVFGPYSEQYMNVDYAKSRATPAYFRAADNTSYLFATGSTKKAVDSQTTVSPSIARLKVVLSPGQAAYLATDLLENTVAMLSPGSPLVSSNGSSNAVVWVLAGNVARLQNLLDPNAGHPILYAFDGNLNLLWNSTQNQLNAGGKYMAPAIARGMVFIGTDRIQAFGAVRSQVSKSEVAIDSGGGQTGIFSSDMDYVGGHSDFDGHAVDTSFAQNPAPMAVYQTRRTGSNGVGFSYVVPGLNPGGTYTVRLHFTEPLVTGVGQRVFSVAIQGAAVLPDFDIYQATGGAYRAAVREFSAVADAAGKISIDYKYGAAGNPLSSGLEVTPTGEEGGVTDLTREGTIIAKVMVPKGGGNKNLEVIRDGDMPPAGSSDSSRQYDSYSGGALSSEDWIGYQYSSMHTFSKVVVEEGKNFVDGGWFNGGTVQVRQGGNWVNVANLRSTPAYPPNDGIGFETYALSFAPTVGDAIRIDGAPGGTAYFISVGELLVYGH
jgi:hypothetical protein